MEDKTLPAIKLPGKVTISPALIAEEAYQVALASPPAPAHEIVLGLVTPQSVNFIFVPAIISFKIIKAKESVSSKLKPTKAMSPDANVVEGGSFIVTGMVQLAVFPASSVAVKTTELTPTPAIVPAVGDCVIVILAGIETLSVAVVPLTKSGMAAIPLVPAMIGAGVGAHEITGGVVSPPVLIVKVHPASKAGL
ncbi:hypothetical protein AEQU3_03468 [Aequorivita antarctica]|nr:hypothetical protein AEQU3_03468 [Aequorivita antarctica]